METDLEGALALAGTGRYQVLHSSIMLLSLLSALLEIIGIAFVLPAAACDLGVPDSLRGIITSIPNIGIILTAPFWGYAADTLGRKPVLIGTCTAAGSIGLLAAFMPNLTSFALTKFAASLFLSCPSSLGFAYASEMVPLKRRDHTVLIINGMLMTLCTFSPVFAWVALSFDFRKTLGVITFRPWRLLTIVNAIPLIVSAALLLTIEESPKFLMMKGRSEQALEVLRRVFAVNCRGRDTYSVKALKNVSEKTEGEEDGSRCALAPKAGSKNALALLRPPHCKWLALTGFLMFGLFSILNGLYLFAPDTINKAMELDTDTGGTICTLMNPTEPQTPSACSDRMSDSTFHILVVTTLVYGVAVIAASLSPLSKRALLVCMYTTVGVACLLAGVLTNKMAAGAAMSALQVTALGIGPLTAYACHLFPTSLRGTAVGAVLMFGRLGSATGANVAGLALATSCTSTFYGFSLLLFFCAGLCMLLPGAQAMTPTQTRDGH